MGYFFEYLFSNYTALIATFLAVFILIKSLMPDEEKVMAQKRLGVDVKKKEFKSLFLKYASFFFPIVLPSIQALKIDKYRHKKRRQLIAADLLSDLTPDEFLCFKFIIGFFVLVAMVFHYGTGNEEIPYGKIVIGTLAGWFFPDLWLRGTTKKRQKDIFRTLPYVMDMLTLSVEAGLDFIAALVRISQKAKPGPLVDEFKILLKEIKLGISRADSLSNMANRIQLSEFSSFVAVLIQADQLGADIGPVLRAQSDLLRVQRFQRAEKAGAEATQKILFPLIFIILPAITIVIFGPIILDYLYNKPG
jgi:tight adherence protein C